MILKLDLKYFRRRVLRLTMKSPVSFFVLLGLLMVLVRVDGTSASGDCHCGKSRVPCERNITVSECPNGRVVARNDCSCCTVCAKQLTEVCNESDLPCDSDYGLTCGQDFKCKAQTQCDDDSSCSTDRFCIGGACADPCNILNICSDQGIKDGVCIVRNHRGMCVCPTGKSLDFKTKECKVHVEPVEVMEEKITTTEISRVTCEKDSRILQIGQNVYSEKCSEICECQNDGILHCSSTVEEPQCPVNKIPMNRLQGEMTENCKALLGNETLEEWNGCCIPEKCAQVENEGNTDRSRDFKLTESFNGLGGGSTGGSSSSNDIGTVENNEEKKSLQSKNGGQKNSVMVVDEQKKDVTKAESTSTSSTTTTTSTTVKVVEDLESSSATTVTTISPTEHVMEIMSESNIGCIYNGTSYEVGQLLLQGCEKSCECQKDGHMKCTDRCSIPFFKKGSFAHDPYCFEETVDECCVIVACARSGGSSNHEARELTVSPCDVTKCGPNALCHSEVTPKMQNDHHGHSEDKPETLCVCLPGFLGDPYDEIHGCKGGSVSSLSTPSLTMKPDSDVISPTDENSESQGRNKMLQGCMFKNKTFAFGVEQYDGCSYKCRCENSGEFLCRPRCSYRRDEEKEIAKGCEIKKDPNDPECCEMLFCNGKPAENSVSRIDAHLPLLPLDGCLYKNKTYLWNQKFYEGCSQQCICFNNGDVTCQPRCPPLPTIPTDDKEKCVTLPDPMDSCCNVTVCEPKEEIALEEDVKKKDGDSKSHKSIDDKKIKPNRLSVSNNKEKLARTEEIFSKSAHATDQSKSTPAADDSVHIRIDSITPINDTALSVAVKMSENDLSRLHKDDLTIEYSNDLKSWKNAIFPMKNLFVEGREELNVIVGDLLPNKEYYLRAKIENSQSNVASGITKKSDKKLQLISSTTPNSPSPMEHEHEQSIGSSEEHSHEHFGMDHSMEMGVSGENDEHSGPISSSEDTMPCKYKEKDIGAGEEFYDNCDNYCACVEGKVQCVPIECPTDGLEFVDSNCLRWEPILDDFNREPPNCCPEMRCIQNSTCSLPGPNGGFVFQNFDEIPQKITGCDKRCYCEFGNVTCHNLCPPLSEKPPKHLKCPVEMAIPVTSSENECCLEWICKDQHKNHTEGSKNGTASTPPNMTHFHDFTTIHNASHEHGSSGEDQILDQFIPPSTGNQPSFVNLKQISPEQLQELLHQLSTIGTGGEQHPHGLPPGHIPPPIAQGTYLSVKNPQEVAELEKHGAKIIEQTDDGNYILFMPNSSPPSSGSAEHDPTNPFIHGGGFPFGHRPIGHVDGQTDEITNVVIRPLNESTLQIDFMVPPILVGLHGVVEVLYTKEFNIKPSPEQWERQVFQQIEDLIDNSHLQLFLTGLEQDTEYHIQIQVLMRDIQNTPSSDILLVRTPSLASTSTLPPEIQVDPEVKLLNISDHSAIITWRKFNDFENSLIDGVQVKYKAHSDQLYATTTMLHRSINSYEISNLQANQEYEIDILFIPFTNQTTELRSEKPIHVSTLPEEDAYSFTIILKAGKVTEQTAEIAYEGVPYPEDKFVNIYQVIYQSDHEKEQKTYFKVPKRDTTKKAEISQLKPGTRYKVYMDVFLTNGKKKRTDVIEIFTKAGTISSTNHHENVLAAVTNVIFLTNNTTDTIYQAVYFCGNQIDILTNSQRSQEPLKESHSYTGALVALAIIASLAILGIVVLLLILIKKQNQAKVPINDRKSESSYDNPSFKNFDLESNGHHTKPGEP